MNRFTLETMTIKRRRVLFWASVLLFFVAIMPIILYSFGYRFSLETHSIQRAGGLSIASTPSTGTNIYINGALEKQTTFLSRDLFLQGLTPHTYSVRIEKEGYYTWEKSVTVNPERVTEIRALLVKQNPDNGTILLRGDYRSITEDDNDQKNIIITDSRGKKRFFSIDKKEFIQTPIYTATSTPVLSSRAAALITEKNPTGFKYDSSGERVVWWKDASLLVTWLRGEDFLPLYTDASTILLFEGDYGIREAQFYPGQDAVIAAYANQLVVIELDGRGGRITYPLYKGKEPSFVIAPGDKTIYILDDGNLITIPLP